MTRSRREYSTISRIASPECATASKEPIKGFVPNPIIPYLWNSAHKSSVNNQQNPHTYTSIHNINIYTFISSINIDTMYIHLKIIYNSSYSKISSIHLIYRLIAIIMVTQLIQ